MILSGIGIITSKAAEAGGYDTDAQAFFTAVDPTGTILTTTEKDAVNTMVLDLKASSPSGTILWSKFLAIYPMVGNTSSSMMYNLKDPRDLNAAYRLYFGGSWNFTTRVAVPSANSYMNTYIQPSTSPLSQNSASFWFYASTAAGSGFENIFGCYASPSVKNGIQLMTGNQGQYLAINGNEGGFTSLGVYSGLLGYSRIASNEFKGYARGILRNTNSQTSTTPISTDIYMGATNNGGTYKEPTTSSCAFGGIATGMDAAEVTALNTIIVTYQTSLSRKGY
jgi:hypothetical protein